MTRRSVCLLVAAAAALTAASAASASAAGSPAPAGRFDISPGYAKALERLPDWNGAWDMARIPGKSHAALLMFDPDHVYLPPDPGGPQGGFDFGPPPGSYDSSIPYKPKYWKKYMAIVARNAQGMITDPVGDCMQPHGMPRQMSAIPIGPYIVMTPTLVMMHWEWLGATRYIFTDGRGHPKGDALAPSYMGDSIGHWEGDTLVVDTVGMFAGQYDQSGAPFSNRIHVLERIYLVDRDTLRDDITVEDPVMLIRPWRVVRDYKRNTAKRLDLHSAYCPPGGNTIDYSHGYQNEVLPMEKDQQQQQQHESPSTGRSSGGRF